MKFLPEIPYPDNEKLKLASLENLFRDWHQYFSSVGSELKDYHADDMVFEGPYPYYFRQPKRILFIGWESRQISGYNYIDLLSYNYRHRKWIGDQHLNANKFHSLMLYITYGVVNGFIDWKDIPDASVIGDTFGTADGVSFAFMNISKLSNEADSRTANWDVINTAYQLSIRDRNFIKDQVAILEPDIVISMGLGDKMDSLGERSLIYSSDDVDCYRLVSAGHPS